MRANKYFVFISSFVPVPRFLWNRYHEWKNPVTDNLISAGDLALLKD